MKAARFAIQEAVTNNDVLDVDIKAVTKEAQLGWLKALIIAAAWGLLKPILLKHVNKRIVDLLDDALSGVF